MSSPDSQANSSAANKSVKSTGRRKMNSQGDGGGGGQPNPPQGDGGSSGSPSGTLAIEVAEGPNKPVVHNQSTENNGDDNNSNQTNHTAHIPPEKIPSLTDLGNDGPAATEVVNYLVQAVGRDVVSFQRNTQVSYMVVERARDIVKEINGLIAKVENSIAVDWNSFEKFTTAIDPLENILFRVLAFTKDEKEQYFASIGSISDCVTSAERWTRNREELFNALGGFDTDEGLDNLFDKSDAESRKREQREAQFYDDRTLLKELTTTIKTNISEDSDRFPNYIQDTEASLDSLRTAIIGSTHSTPDLEWLTVVTIQTSILVEGVVKIVKEATLGTNILNHLKSKPVWKAASELIEDIIQNKTQSVLPDSVKEKYSAFIEILPALGGLALPKAYVELIKKVGHIRCPFQAQAIALVKLCHFLADEFNAIGESITVEHSNSLDEAFDKTLAVLKAAIQAVSDFKSFDPYNFESHPTVQEFAVAEGLIHAGFKSFKLDDEWAKRQSDLPAARNKDKKRMEDLSDVFSRNSSRTPTKVTVNVDIHDKSGQLLGRASVEEEETMRLLALRWSVTGVLNPEEKKRARDDGTFFKEDGRSKLALQSTLANIVRDNAGKSEVTLKLVVP